jgi:SET domain-containing protein
MEAGRRDRRHDAAKCTRLGGQKTAQTRMVFLMQKNTMQKHFTPVGSFCRSVLSEEHFNKNTSHPWGLFVDRTFPLQKDFTPLGSFCRSVLSEEHFNKKTSHPWGLFVDRTFDPDHTWIQFDKKTSDP